MEAKVIWLLVFVGLYWAYCLFWGIKGYFASKTASDYFIAGRKLPMWVYILAATATSFSGWTFMGHPGLVYRDGLVYAYASFYAVTIPFTGVLFLKRQWMLGKHFGYVTPGELFADYFQGHFIRILVVVITLFFSIPYLGVQLGASGFLFSVLTDDMISRAVGMWLLTIVVIVYVASGGLRSVAYVDSAQCVMLMFGIAAIGIIALVEVGGFAALTAGMADLARLEAVDWMPGQGTTGADYFAIPGVIQFTAGLGVETPASGIWTGMMILTYMFALMGIQAAPAFTMWSFSNNDPRPFAPQQVWASAFLMGAILFSATAIQGMGAHLLGGNEVANEAGLVAEGMMLMPPELQDNPDAVVPYYLNAIADAVPWFTALLAVCALAAMQSTGAAYMSTAGAILTRDLYKQYFNPNASHLLQKTIGRTGVVVIALLALTLATLSTDALVLMGGVAVAYGFQMWPTLAAICYFPWITRQGASWGLLAGILGVSFTEDLGIALLAAFGIDVPWGRWPWTIHSAGWGMIFNLGVVLVVSALTQNKTAYAHRMTFHNFLREHAVLPQSKKALIPWAWAVALAWFIFAVGPGAVIGNTIFGAPTAGVEGWLFGIPSIWAWQILMWILGVAMMWFLAYKMELASMPSKTIEVLSEDIGDTGVAAQKERAAAGSGGQQGRR